ncbi:hypothetical protein JOC37_000561, partial [Desulfohalotomaculum tongense]|nr:hypothetical protein [Desulforadius tongensis]
SRALSSQRVRAIIRLTIIQRNYPFTQNNLHSQSLVPSELNRQFKQKEHLSVVVSDLTYVRVGMS